MSVQRPVAALMRSTDENENTLNKLSTSQKVCDSCGNEFLADSRFCRRCGAPRKTCSEDVAKKYPAESTSCRLSELARPRSHLAPSSAELEKRSVEAKREELQELRRQNERSCHEAIHNPAAAPQYSSKVTMPKEFNLRSTPLRSRSVCSDMELDSDSEGWSTSLRGRSKSRDAGSWKPKLTVPNAPALHTSWRPRSVSRGRGCGEQALQPQSWSGSLRSSRSVGAASRSSSRASSRDNSAAPSPARSTRSVRSARSARSARSRAPRLEAPVFEVSSPRRALSRGPGRSSLLRTPSPARSVQSCSDMSLSVGSRLSRLSRRSSSRHSCLSTADLEELQAEEGKRRLSEQLAHNARIYKQAINFPDMRRGHHSLELTVPDEFNLSVGNRSSRSYGPGNVGSQGSRKEDWSQSLRASQSPLRGAQAASLTAPSAPVLRTSSRQRSSSMRRMEAGDASKRSMSCHRMTQREQAAVQKHLQRSASVAVDLQATGAAKGRQLTEGDKLWIQAAASAEEKAERARRAMQKRSEEAWQEEKQRLHVFAARTGVERSKSAAALQASTPRES